MLNLYWNSRVLEALALDELALGYRWLLSNGLPSDMLGERYAFITTGPGIAAKLGLEVDFAIALSEPEQDEHGIYHVMRMPAATAPLLAGMIGLRWQIAEVLANGVYRPRLGGELKIGSITGYNPPAETPVFSDGGILIIEDDESDQAVPTRRLRAIGTGRRGVASYVARFLAGRIAEPTEAAEFALLQKPAVEAAQEGRGLIDGAITDLGVATALEFAKVDDKLDVVDGKIGEVEARADAALNPVTGSIALRPTKVELADPDEDGEAAKIGWRQAGNIAAGRTMYHKLREMPVSPEDIDTYAGTGGDDTEAIREAVSYVGRTAFFTSGKTYRISSAIKPAISGVTMLGRAGDGGGSLRPDDLDGRPRLLMLPGAAALIDPFGVRGLTISGLVLDGNDRTAPVIAAGFSRLKLRDYRIINGSHGIGGRPLDRADGDIYCRTIDALGGIISQCGIGLRNPIDSRFTAIDIASNGVNIRADSGSNSNRFISPRIEHAEIMEGVTNSGRNLWLNGVDGDPVTGWCLDGAQLDRGRKSNVIANARDIAFNGGWAKRANGSLSNDPVDDCLFYLIGDDAVFFTGMDFKQGKDDGSGPIQTPSPNYVFSFGGLNKNVSVVGGGVNSEQAFTSFYRGTAPENFTVLGVAGAPDFANNPTGLQIAGAERFRARDGMGNIPKNAGSPNSNSKTLPTRLIVPLNDTRTLTLAVGARNPSTGHTASAEFAVNLRRGGSAVSVSSYVKQQGTSNGAANMWGVGSGTLALSLTATTDGSAVTATVTNNDPGVDWAVPDIKLL